MRSAFPGEKLRDAHRLLAGSKTSCFKEAVLYEAVNRQHKSLDQRRLYPIASGRLEGFFPCSRQPLRTFPRRGHGG
ncbi:hypothetical protein MPNT_20174 [Candidatus Methylacidithermus pantelleriae]|uniref:Uncharacterized protein n=1 Tax=Candidatus Methylacidithermus pantelleriae TaxID=2744239 RepID=A0A8J2BKJ7_9BACT|nr:hypothetical protein MPNT_20174 [Candidatus Methylacidithermus pantelleriae]